MSGDPKTDASSQDPGYSRVRDYLLFGLSLPERALRSASGIVGGTLRESASLLVPRAFQDSKSYSVLIRQMLDFLAEDVGGVERAEGAEASPKVEDFVARKAVGNFIDLAGMATLHLSPLVLLAVVSDVAYGSQAYLRELAGELKERGVIDRDSTVDHVDDLLEAVASAAETTASALNTPPLSLDGLKRTVDQTRAAVAKLDPTKVIPQAEVKRLWEDIHAIATREEVSPLAVSGTMTLYLLGKMGRIGRGALSTVTVAGTLLDRHVIDHYAAALGKIRRVGLYPTLADTSKPYIDVVRKKFSTENKTLTEKLLSGQWIGQAWHAVCRRLGRGGQGSFPSTGDEPKPPSPSGGWPG